MPFYDPPEPIFQDRVEAGEVLAEKLLPYQENNLIVIAVPNGGVPVGFCIAQKLNIPFYLTIIRKLQIPDNPEAGFGALTSDGFLLLNHKLIKYLKLSKKDIKKQKEKAQTNIHFKMDYFKNWMKLPDLKTRTVVLVDDGLASGFTMEAAVQSVKNKDAKDTLIAIPTASLSAYRRLKSKVNKIICPHISRLPIFAVADAYENWYDVEDKEVLDLLQTKS